jgi:phosphoenolpyruvate carboxykinase (GTP)
MATHPDLEALRARMNAASFDKLTALKNDHVLSFVSEFVDLCQPETVYVCDDSAADRAYIRRRTVERAEEHPLATEGHTIHFDGPTDQGRDKEKTRYLVPEGVNLGKGLATTEKQAGLTEIRAIFKDSMRGKELYVRFFCLGPVASEFSLSCVQLTDSAYVAHSEDLLFRAGYEQFKRLGNSPEFFRFAHTAGELEHGVSRNTDQRRIYIDLGDRIVYSSNTQYAGNTVGLKKLAMRLAINKSKDEGWLTEHMFVMGIHGPGGRKTYFTGAFPSACGKTSTAMLPGEAIVGDDIAYLRARDNKCYAVNVEKGIFGIVQDVNAKDDPVIWDVLTSTGEVIFSNVLKGPDNRPYWLGMGVDPPETGVNFQGEWQTGKTDANGKAIPHAHKNARYTVEIERLANCDEKLNAPEGVEVGGFVYGGRDSNTSVPVVEAFDYTHGIITMGALLESETTAATLGQEGVRKFNLMSILDFLAYPLGEYIQNNLDFGNGLAAPPRVYGVNYFIKGKDGKYLTGMSDKHVWMKWAELRVHGDVDAIETPVGYIPKYDDLKALFKAVLDKEYTEAQYTTQFMTRIPELLAKLERVRKVYEEIPSTPHAFFDTVDAQASRLGELQMAKGDYVSPFDL